MYISLHVKYTLFLSDFNANWIFSTDFRKILKTSNFMKIRPVRAELFHADRRTDGRTDRYNEANSRFSQLCEGGQKAKLTAQHLMLITDHKNIHTSYWWHLFLSLAKACPVALTWHVSDCYDRIWRRLPIERICLGLAQDICSWQTER